MRIRLLAALAVLITLIVAAAPAAAQEGEGASVVILKFEVFDVPKPTVDAFTTELTSTIDAASEMYVKTGGEVSIKDLLLTVGCEEPSAECLTGLRDFVDADRIVFGSVQGSDDVTLFTVRMFDFAEARFVREIVDQTVQGSQEEVRAALPAVAEAFVYGDTGVVTVDVAGADDAEIFFDGEKVGVAPMTLENMPLGEHAITVKNRDGEERTEKVLLRHNQAETVSFSFEGADLDDPVAAGEGPSALPGWISVGVGLVGAGVGVYGLIEESSVDSDLEALCAQGNSFGNECTGENAALGSTDPSEVNALIDDGGTAKTLQLVGFSVAAVGLAVGGYLLYAAYSGAPPETAGTDETAGGDRDEESPISDLTFGVAPTSEGVSAGLGFTF